MRYNFLLLIPLLALSQILSAQEIIDDVTDFFEFEIHGKNRDTNHYTTKLVIAPIVSYEPSTSLGIGGGTKLLFKPKKAGKESRTSNIPLSLKYTLKNQFIFSSEYDIFFPEEKYLLKGSLKFSKFPVGYFGIGNQSHSKNKIEVSFNQFLIEPLLLKKVKKYFFVGGGMRSFFTRGAEIKDEEGSHLSLKDSLNNFSLGIEFASTLDSRDNVLNATDGILFEFTHGIYDKIIGSQQNYMLTKANFRKYFRVDPNKLDVIAIEAYTRLSWGNPPLLDLSKLGGTELLRGFQEGRFRDRFAYFSQIEYRWQTFERFGFVFYGGAGSVMNETENFNLGDLKYSLGTGLRFKIVKSENLNIRLDYAFGFGNENANNFYVGIAEAF